MQAIGTGDLARSLLFGASAARLRAEITRLSGETVTGLRADPAAAGFGDAAARAAIARDLARLAALKAVAVETGQRAAAIQAALGTIAEDVASLGVRLAAAAALPRPAATEALAAEAGERFAAAVSALNARVADRSLFAGGATDRPALAPPREILDALAAAVAGETTAGGVAAAVTAWFAAPAGGFVDLAYRGGPPAAPIPLGAGDAADPGPTAADPALRAALEGLALGALLARGVLAGDAAERAALAGEAGARLVAAEPGLAALRARAGQSEADISRARARGETEAAAFELARLGLTAADPYAAAARLREAEGQLERLHLLTARLARLSLAEFLR